jgi:hypothetical protein
MNSLASRQFDQMWFKMPSKIIIYCFWQSCNYKEMKLIFIFYNLEKQTTMYCAKKTCVVINSLDLRGAAKCVAIEEC